MYNAVVTCAAEMKFTAGLPPIRPVNIMKSISLRKTICISVWLAVLFIAAAVFLAPALSITASASAPYYPTNGTIYDGDFGYEIDYSTGRLTATITAYSPVDLSKANGTVTIPDTISSNKYPVTSIAPYAFGDFYDQSLIVNVKLPKDLVSVGDNAFRGCYFLEKVDFSKNLQKIGNSAFEGCYSLKELKIPDTVTDIGNSAFFGCTGITKMTLSKNLVNLGQSAFSGCTSLTAAEFPETVDYIGPSAFEGCSRLKTVKLPKLFDTISDYTFNNCSALAVINMPENLDSIGEGAFMGCTSLNAVTLPASIQAIARLAFTNCTNLSTVVVPYDLDNISDGAFSGTRAVIWGYSGSYAEEYAHRNGLDFRSTGTLYLITFSSDNYNATVNNISIITDKGLYLVPPSSVASGDKLTISVSAPPGYDINRIMINNAQFANGTVYTVTDSDVNIFVSYKSKAQTTTTTAAPQTTTTTTTTTRAAVTVVSENVDDEPPGDTTRPADDTDSDYIIVDSDLEDVNGANVRIVTQRDYFIAPATVRITNTAEAYDAAKSAAESLDGADGSIYYAFDISLLDESGEENQRIMARGTITFMLPIPNELLPYADKIKVYHINDEQPELLRSSVIEDINGVKRLQFESDSFSPYMLLAETDGSIPVIDEETTQPVDPDDEIGEIVEPYDDEDSDNGGSGIVTQQTNKTPDAQIVEDDTKKPSPTYNSGLNPHTGAIIAALIPVVILVCILLVRSHKKRKRTKTNVE